MFCNFLGDFYGDFCFSALGEFRFFVGLIRGVPDFEVFWSVLRARYESRCAAVEVRAAPLWCFSAVHQVNSTKY